MFHMTIMGDSTNLSPAWLKLMNIHKTKKHIIHKLCIVDICIILEHNIEIVLQWFYAICVSVPPYLKIVIGLWLHVDVQSFTDIAESGIMKHIILSPFKKPVIYCIIRCHFCYIACQVLRCVKLHIDE